MTKPADQIAKARREAYKLLFGEHCQEIYSTPVSELSSEAQKEIAHYTKSLLAFAASERQAVIEECCRAVCQGCKTGWPLTDTKWFHRSPEGGLMNCIAFPIRSME